ncbi:MAG: hypothetical protein V4534_01120 [Myxococcota bacterium]
MMSMFVAFLNVVKFGTFILSVCGLGYFRYQAAERKDVSQLSLKQQQDNELLKLEKLWKGAQERFPDVEPQDLEEKIVLTTMHRLAREDTVEELKGHFDFYGNSNLENAKVLLFAENHTNPLIVQENFQLLLSLLKPGDIVLFEMPFEKMSVYSNLVFKLARLEFPSLPLDMSRVAKETNIDGLLGVTGAGWDLARKKPNSLEKHVLHLRMHFLNSELRNRNAALPKILSKLTCKRVFVIAGAMHLPFAYTYKSSKELAITESLDQMRSDLDPYPWVVVSSKEFTRSKIAPPTVDQAVQSVLVFGVVVSGSLISIGLLSAKAGYPQIGLAFQGFLIALITNGVRGNLVKPLEDIKLTHFDGICPEPVDGLN